MNKKYALHWTIAVASLGYFVDIYDLQLFNIISKSSLKGIGITDQVEIDRWDYLLFLWQMGGMLVGGIIWGWLGDVKGRKQILFGSILLYSLANIANAFVTNVEAYSAIRFIAGLGLAGELGAAITLVSEIMDKEKRGYGTMVIVTMGALGAIGAVFVSKLTIPFFQLTSWQTSYIIGGLLGLLLLSLRVGTFESGLFEKGANTHGERGNFFILFKHKERALRYLACIAMGLPVWFCVGILIKFSKTFAALSQLEIDASMSIVFTYLGLSFGDLMSSLLSQYLKSRKKTISIYLWITVLITTVYLMVHPVGLYSFYFLCFALGTATGYWALFVSMSAELFGTNIRATVASTTPNFVRGSVVPLILTFKYLEPLLGSVFAAAILGVVCIGLALISTNYLQESFGKDLDFKEV